MSRKHVTKKQRAGATVTEKGERREIEVNAHIWLAGEPRIYGCATSDADTLFLRAAGAGAVDTLATTLIELGQSMRQQLKQIYEAKENRKNTA